MRPRLTIGMAVYNDFSGPYFTIQALRLYHEVCMSNIEIIVIDNKPDSFASGQLRNLLEHAKHGLAGCKYVAAGEVQGTAAPRDRVFEEATGDVVMCIDSHVLVHPGAISRLMDWYQENPDCMDLVTGPLVYDSLESIATHFNPVWRGEMFGIWGQAWGPCAEGELVSVIEGPNKEACFIALDPTGTPRTSSAACGIKYPTIPYAGHQQALKALGWRRMGDSPHDEFEIPGQGLGLFACRKDAWVGFNANFRGFGGEEMYIHEKFRQAGRRNLCLGFLRWTHRFGRETPAPPYRLTVWDKVRNYVLGHNEVGWPLDEVKAHFVPKHLSEVDWNVLVADPLRPTQPKKEEAPMGEKTVDEIFDMVAAKPRDLDQHMLRMRQLAMKCPRIVEFTHRRESTIAFVAGIAEGGSLISYNTEDKDPLLRQCMQQRKDEVLFHTSNQISQDVAEISECDLLFIDSKHTAGVLTGELQKFAIQVKRFIALHDTQLHGNSGEDGGPGLLGPLKALCDKGEWFVAFHTTVQHGFTILGRLEEDRPEKPIVIWPLGYGPGTELSAILESLGIVPAPSCDCKAKANKMDIWGVEGCKENREQIIKWMQDGQVRWGWKDKVAAVAAAVATGLAFKLNPMDPYPGLIDESIRRAEEKGVPSAT